MAEKKQTLSRSARTGRFVTGSSAKNAKTVTVITDVSSKGRIGSYELRTVDVKRFNKAKAAANTALREYRKK